MVYDIVDLLGIELMEYGHSNGAIGEGGEECHGPLAGVAAGKGYLVTFHNAAILEKDMQLLDFAGHIMILQRLSLEVGQGVAIPVVDDALLDQ